MLEYLSILMMNNVQLQEMQPNTFGHHYYFGSFAVYSFFLGTIFSGAL